jgi:hypothetical protein
VLLQVKVRVQDGMQMANLGVDFRQACRLLEALVCTQVGASTSGSSSSSAATRMSNEPKQQQQCQHVWLLPLLLTCIEAAAAWPQEASSSRAAPQLELVAACADLIIASLYAAPPDEAAALAEQLLPAALHELGGVVLEVGQAAAAEHLSRYCVLLEVLLGTGEQSASTRCCNTV